MIGVVIHGDFGFGYRSSEFGVVHEDFAAFVDFTGFVELLEGPPDGFHEVFVHGAVAVVEIDPTTDAVDGASPSLGICNHGFTGFDDVILEGPFGADVATVGDAELFLDEVLGGETVAIPAPTTFNSVAVHGPETWDGIFYYRA